MPEKPSISGPEGPRKIWALWVEKMGPSGNEPLTNSLQVGGVDELGIGVYTDDEVPMKKETPKKSRKARGSSQLEFERGWAELEAQHDRIKTDWMSLAAQLGVLK